MNENYKIGQIVEGTVTGIQDYGVFVALDKHTQGLIHISEVKHGYISEINSIVKEGQKIEAIIIDIDEYTKKISLSLRALEKLPIPSKPGPKLKPRRRHYPQIGFDTLAKAIPKWIKEFHQTEESKHTQK